MRIQPHTHRELAGFALANGVVVAFLIVVGSLVFLSRALVL